MATVGKPVVPVPAATVLPVVSSPSKGPGEGLVQRFVQVTARARCWVPGGLQRRLFGTPEDAAPCAV